MKEGCSLRVILVLLVTLIGAATATAPRAWAKHEMCALPTGSVVRLTAVKYENAHGSGVVVAPGVVLTAKHVVEAGLRYGGLVLNGKPAHAYMGARDRDLALVLVDTGDASPVPIAESPPAPGEHVTLAGYPTVFGVVKTAGSVMEEHEGRILTTARAAQGMSGGPLVRCLGGRTELVGVLTSVGAQNGRGGPFPIRVPLNMISLSVHVVDLADISWEAPAGE